MRRPGGHPLIAACLDLVMAPMAHLRPKVVGPATGRVLEVGVGTGLNLQHYTGAVHEVVGIEPDPHMIRRARARAASAAVPVRLEQASGERLPFPDASFDTVVLTWVLCSIPDVESAVAELHRVLRPGGRVLAIEHTRASSSFMAGAQRVIDPVWQRLAGGCHLCRDPWALLVGAGFEVEAVTPCGSELHLVPVYRGTLVRGSALDSAQAVGERDGQPDGGHDVEE